jgi:hypothetical protein
MTRAYKPRAHPIPESWRRAVIARDADGHCVVQDYIIVVTPWIASA